jgi:hypothetical protein
VNWVEVGLKDKSQQNAIADLVLVLQVFFGLGKASMKDPLCFDGQLVSRGEIKMQEENRRHNKHRETLWACGLWLL